MKSKIQYVALSVAHLFVSVIVYAFAALLFVEFFKGEFTALSSSMTLNLIVGCLVDLVVLTICKNKFRAYEETIPYFKVCNKDNDTRMKTGSQYVDSIAQMVVATTIYLVVFYIMTLLGNSSLTVVVSASLLILLTFMKMNGGLDLFGANCHIGYNEHAQEYESII